MRRGMFLLLLVLSSTLMLAEDTRLQVKHDHGLRSCRGELVFRDDGVEYVTSHKEDARTWNYVDIQQLGLKSDKKISVVTYEDRKLQFGKDKIFNFEITEGSIPPALAGMLQTRLTKPLVSAVIPEIPAARYQLPVKHQHALGGCQGDLEIGEQQVVYKTSHRSDSRIWRYEDLSSIGSTGPFQLRLSGMERTNGEHGAEKNFIFDLKRRLDPEIYDFLWGKINLPRINSSWVTHSDRLAGWPATPIVKTRIIALEVSNRRFNELPS